MRPVYQAVVDNQIGDCWRCCIASILELDRDEVPNFTEADAWAHERMREWAAARGLAYASIDTRHWRGGTGLDVRYGFRWDDLVGVHAIAIVPSQRFTDCSHAVVIRWEPGDVEGSVRVVVAHDPNPGNAPYDLGALTLNQVAFLVPISLAAWRAP